MVSNLIERWMLRLAAWLLKRLPSGRRFELLAVDELRELQQTAAAVTNVREWPKHDLTPPFRVRALVADGSVILYEGASGYAAKAVYDATDAAAANSVEFWNFGSRLSVKP